MTRTTTPTTRRPAPPPPSRGVAPAVLAVAAALALPAPGGAAAQASTATIRLTVDKVRVQVGDTLDVQIRAEVSGAPVRGVDPPPFDGFDVVGRSTHQPRQFTFRFGGRIELFESTTVEVFRLRAREAGRFELGPATLRTDDRTVESDVVTVLVDPGPGGLTRVDPGSADATAPDDAAGVDLADAYDPVAFVYTTTRPDAPVVGEQVTVDVLLYVAERLRHSPAVLREPSADGFWVHDLQDRTRLGEARVVTVRGRRFYAYLLRRFAAFPLRTGELVIGPSTVRVQTGGLRGFGVLGGGGEAVERRSPPATVSVAPLPTEGRPAGVDPDDVAVGDFDLRVSVDRRAVEVGEAVELTASVKGTGNLKTVHLELPPIPGVDVLPSETEDALEVGADRVGGRREIRWLLVPRTPGSHAVPQLRLVTFDPASGAWRERVGATPTLIARGDPAPTPTPDAAAPDPTPAPAPEATRFGPLRTESALERDVTPLSSEPWYPWAAAGPPALLLLALAGARLTDPRRAARRDATDPRRWLREARRELARASKAARRGDEDPGAAHARVGRILEGVLGRLLGEPVGGYTRRELGELLRARGLGEPLARRVVAELERADEARFGGAAATPEGVGEAAAHAARLLDELGRARPREAPR